METSRSDLFAGSLRTLFEVGPVAGLSDGELLGRFLDRRGEGEAAEIAFAALVERHGSMVLRVCRSKLGDDHDAQDAFQATFLILARRAGSIRHRGSAASWLHGVARRVAACARRASSLRRTKERSAVRTSESSLDGDALELAPIVREEVGGLPEKYRTPLVLCLLDGLTHEEAASRLGCPVGTVKTRVRWAKARLRTRLARRGLAPSLGTIGAALASTEARAVPAALVRSTARAAMQFMSGRVAAGAVSASVAKLVDLGWRSLVMSRLTMVALVFASVGVFGIGAVGLARQGPEPRKVEKVVAGQSAPIIPTDPPKSDAAGSDEAKILAEVELLERMKELDFSAEILRMEIEMLKPEMRRLQEKIFELDGQQRGFVRGEMMSEESYKKSIDDIENMKKSYENIKDYLISRYVELNKKLVDKEWDLRLLTKELDWSLPSDFSRSPVAREQDGGVRFDEMDRRLSGVEQKLDLILKALQVRGGESGKE
ncbi:RNA polymerase sigma factor [Tundrisphaera lichenicola]|uniref:RNA polymerase sigma factor n=1 Tax=Tundrisphaera lichenicola TaxID=2029860 RepID=UPI003EBFA847